MQTRLVKKRGSETAGGKQTGVKKLRKAGIEDNDGNQSEEDEDHEHETPNEMALGFPHNSKPSREAEFDGGRLHRAK